MKSLRTLPLAAKLLIVTALLAVTPLLMAPGQPCMGCIYLRTASGKLVRIKRSALKKQRKRKNCCVRQLRNGRFQAMKGTRVFRRFGKRPLVLKRKGFTLLPGLPSRPKAAKKNLKPKAKAKTRKHLRSRAARQKPRRGKGTSK